MLCMYFLLRASQTKTLESSEPEQDRPDVWLASAQLFTMPLWSVYLRMRVPLLASHRATVLSAEQDRSLSPSHFTSRMAFLCPLRTL